MYGKRDVDANLKKDVLRLLRFAKELLRFFYMFNLTLVPKTDD
jgi:hypothetical protein